MDYATALFNLKITAEVLDKWRGDLSELPTIEEQQKYYDTVISPALTKLDKVIDHRHLRHRDGREFEKMVLHDESLDDLAEVVFKKSPDFLHELVSDPVLCCILKRLSPDQKEVIYNNAVMECSVTEISVIKRTSDRNIRKTKEKAIRHIRGQMLPVIMFRYKIQVQEKYRWLFVRGVSTTFKERMFAATIGEDYVDYYDEYEITEKTKEDTVRYAEYFRKHVMDFVTITKDYREQAQRMRDNTARLKDAKRRYEEQEEKKKLLQKQNDYGNIIDDDNSYSEEVADDYAQDI